jgi:hypothetical protein
MREPESCEISISFYEQRMAEMRKYGLLMFVIPAFWCRFQGAFLSDLKFPGSATTPVEASRWN